MPQGWFWSRSTRRRIPNSDALGIEGISDAEEIGRGGFGLVYRAREPALHRTVAVKLLPVAGLTAGDQARFQRELHAMGALSGHPAIVTIHRGGMSAHKQPYMVMELMVGGSLTEWLRSHPPLSWAAVVAIGHDLAEALEASHSLGILHRDVKPQNLLVNAHGQVKLADFGIARLRGADHTRSSVLMVSLEHAPPEVLQGGPPSAAGDVYGLASSLITLLRGVPPYTQEADDSPGAILTRILTSPPPELNAAAVPPEVAGVLLEGLARNPHARPDAIAFAQRLRVAAAAAGVPVDAGRREAVTLLRDAASRSNFNSSAETIAMTRPSKSDPSDDPEEISAPSRHAATRTSGHRLTRAVFGAGIGTTLFVALLGAVSTIALLGGRNHAGPSSQGHRPSPPPSPSPYLLPAATTALRAGWNILATPPKDTVMRWVSCPANLECYAVGQNQTNNHSVLLEWDGIRWRFTSEGAGPTRISCATGGFCMGVDGLGVLWGGFNRPNWDSLAEFDSPLLNVSFSSISCATRYFCMAVGQQNGERAAFAEWDGAKWTLGTNLGPGRLISVSCPTPTFCMAAGFAKAKAATGPPGPNEFYAGGATLLKAWDGATWVSVNSPNVSSRFQEVSCVSQSFCMAIGASLDSTTPLPWAEVWSGAGWKSVSTPKKFADDFLGWDTNPISLSCAAANFCVSGTERWDGSSWSRMGSNPPGGHVSCATTASCMAAGANLEEWRAP